LHKGNSKYGQRSSAKAMVHSLNKADKVHKKVQLPKPKQTNPRDTTALASTDT
jgi:hypothetical protein